MSRNCVIDLRLGPAYGLRVALVNLVRLSVVARLLGVSCHTARAWAAATGVTIIRSPLAGRSTLGASPAYVSVPDAVAIIDRMLPRQVDRAANRRAHARLREQAARLTDSTRNLQHEVGGTGSDAPPPKPAL